MYFYQIIIWNKEILYTQNQNIVEANIFKVPELWFEFLLVCPIAHAIHMTNDGKAENCFYTVNTGRNFVVNEWMADK